MESTQVGITPLTSRNNIPHPILYLSLLILGQLFSQMHTHGVCPSSAREAEAPEEENKVT